jgi:hypothetical protein
MSPTITREQCNKPTGVQMDMLGSVAGLLGLVVGIVGIWLAMRHTSEA